MNILFYLEPLIIQNSPYLFCGWLPLWSKLIKTLEKSSTNNIQFKMITSQAIHSIISQFNMPGNLDVIPIPLEEVVEKFNYSSMNACIAWYKGVYSAQQLEYTAKLFAYKLNGWVPDVIITSSQVPFLKENFPKAIFLQFEAGMTSRPPFSPSWYLDPVGLFRFSFLVKYSDVINKEFITPPARSLLDKYRNFFVSMIDSKAIFRRFAESFANKFSHVILVPLQTEGVGFLGNCDFSSEFQFVHKLLSKIDPKIGVVITPHPSNPSFTDDIVQYFERKFPNFLYTPDILQVSSASQYLFQYVDAVLSISSMVGLQALIWKKKLFAIGETHLKVGAEYCFKPDLSDIDRLPELLSKPTTDKDNVLFWLLTRFYVPDIYFFDPSWLFSFISRLMKANESGNLSMHAFPLIDEPDKVFFHIFEGAILDIPRYRGRELVTLTHTFEEKIYVLQSTYACLNEDPNDNFWLTLLKRNYNEHIMFSNETNNVILLINGWSQVEGWGVWSQGTVADVLISLPPNFGKDIILHGDWQGFVTVDHPHQIIDVFVNNEKLGNLSFEFGREHTNHEITIPTRVFNNSTSQTHIRFLINSPVSPASLGLSSDTRQLGIGLFSLQFNLLS